MNCFESKEIVELFKQREKTTFRDLYDSDYRPLFAVLLKLDKEPEIALAEVQHHHVSFVLTENKERWVDDILGRIALLETPHRWEVVIQKSLFPREDIFNNYRPKQYYNHDGSPKRAFLAPQHFVTYVTLRYKDTVVPFDTYLEMREIILGKNPS